MPDDTSFARLVSLACHDVLTPLATVKGFAATTARHVEVPAPGDHYLRIIEEASRQMEELVKELALAARIEAGRYEPALRDTDTLELAQSAAERLGADRVHVSGEGAVIQTDLEAVDRGVSALVQAALRHGGLSEVELSVRGNEIDVTPVTESSAKVVLGEDLRDLGAAVAVRLIETLGGSVAVSSRTLTIRLG